MYEAANIIKFGFNRFLKDPYCIIFLSTCQCKDYQCMLVGDIGVLSSIMIVYCLRLLRLILYARPTRGQLCSKPHQAPLLGGGGGWLVLIVNCDQVMD